MAELDLDARRATLETKTIRLGGETFDLPAELPVLFGVALAEGRIEDAFTGMLGKAKGLRLAGLLSQDEILLFAGLYGVELGESEASPTS